MSFSPYVRSTQLAVQLQQLLGPDRVQQRVAALCPNDVSYVITQWATWMAGHICTWALGHFLTRGNYHT